MEILNPYVFLRIRGMKDSYLDVKARLADGTLVIIKMQVLNVEGFEKRILFNAAQSFSTQLDIGDAYTLLNPVIALMITDFVMFPDLETVISRFVLKEKEFLVDYPYHDIELVFAELPKFQKSLEALVDLTDRWLFFLKSASDLRTVPEPMADLLAFQKAFAAANEATLTPEEYDELLHQNFFIQDYRGAMSLAIRQATTKVRAEVERDTRRDIARNLLKTMDAEAVSLATGLSLAEVEALRSQPDSPN